jgi:hypothetical protein
MKYLVSVFIFLLSFESFAQSKLQVDASFQTTINERCKIILPSNYDNSKSYPLVIFMPFTGGTGQDYFEGYLYEIGQPTENTISNKSLDNIISGLSENGYPKNKEFIALLLPEAGSTKDHSWQGFTACIYRHENRILTDIDYYSSLYSIDKSNVVLAGFSLGGDLSWAISQRYPSRIKGIIISGTRCGYYENGSMTKLKDNSFKAFIAMGRSEAKVRLDGAMAASNKLNNASVSRIFEYIENADHTPTTFSQLRSALDYILPYTKSSSNIGSNTNSNSNSSSNTNSSSTISSSSTTNSTSNTSIVTQILRKVDEENKEGVSLQEGCKTDLNFNKFIPYGSYLKSSKNISISIIANVKQPNGSIKRVVVMYSDKQTVNMQDIMVTNGNLVVVNGSTNLRQKNSGGLFFPDGSWNNSIVNDKKNYITKVVIYATCKNNQGDWVKTQPLEISSEEIQNGLKDIINNNGQLSVDY